MKVLKIQKNKIIQKADKKKAKEKGADNPLSWRAECSVSLQHAK